MAWLLYREVERHPGGDAALLVGKNAPGLRGELRDAPGRFIDSRALLGRVWLLHAWASWCAACREERAPLAALARAAAVPVVGLATLDEHDAALAWLARAGNPYDATVWDASGLVAAHYGVRALPQTFLIDKHGIVRYAAAGGLTSTRAQTELLALVRQLQAQD